MGMILCESKHSDKLLFLFEYTGFSLSLFSKVTFSRSPGAWLHTLGFCVYPCVCLPARQPVPPPLLPRQGALREGWKVNTFFIFLNRRIRAGPAPCWCSLLVLVVSWFIKRALTPCCSATQSCLSRPRGLQHASLPCPSPSPGICSNSRLLSQWCHPAISSSVAPFSSWPQSLCNKWF